MGVTASAHGGYVCFSVTFVERYDKLIALELKMQASKIQDS